METPQVEADGIPSELRIIPEREWPESFEQYRRLIIIRGRRRKAFWWSNAGIALVCAFTALLAFAPPGWEDGWTVTIFNAFFAVLAPIAGYHVLAAGLARCPRCAWVFHFSLLRIMIGVSLLWWRRCGRCELNLDTATPALSRYFHRRFGIPHREDDGYSGLPQIFR